MSTKGLEWARRLRAELEARISELREALAGIEPLRQELARLEEQQRGVERLIAAYETQLGFEKKHEYLVPRAAPPVATGGAATGEEASEPLADAAPLAVAPPPPAVVDVLRPTLLGVVAACRQTAVRLWLSARVWISRHFLHSNA